MSEFEKIKEQDEVFENSGKNRIVSASAGSGKTTVMIEQIKKLIIDKGVDVSSLLVLTYTNASAAEMKQKLVASLENNVEQLPNLISQIEKIDLCDICTFDSFCQNLIKKYFYIAEIDPNFCVLTGSNAKVMQKKAVQKALENYKVKKPKQFMEIFDCLCTNRKEDNLQDIVIDLFEFCCSILNQNDFEDKCQKLFEGEVDIAMEIVFDDFVTKTKHQKSLIEGCVLSAQKLCEDKLEQSAKNILENIDIALSATNLKTLLFVLTGVEFKRMTSAKVQNELLKEQISKINKYVKKLFAGIAKYTDYENLQRAKKSCQTKIQILLEMLAFFQDEYFKNKQKINSYDFNDIERLAIKVLENDFVKEQTQEKYKHIFVDEFQDANQIQKLIVDLIKSKNNVFFVGDLKQAIYGFRQSSSEIFEEVIKQFQNQEESASLYLNCNFRTNKNVVEFINNVFCSVMTLKTASLDYEGKAKLVPRSKIEDDLEPCVELNIIKSLDKPQYVASEDASEDESDDSPTSVIAQSFLIAQKITQLTMQKTYNEKTKKYENVEFADIAILLRKRSNQSVLVEVLNKFDIPVIQNSSKKLEDEFDNMVLMNMIKLCKNRQDDIALCSVMLSCLFDFSTTDLQQIALAKTKQKFCEKVYTYSGDCELMKKIQNLINTINEFESDVDFKGLYFALLNLEKKCDIIFKLDSINSARAKVVGDYISTFSGSVFEFDVSSYIKFIQNNKRENTINISSPNKNAVTITTMHSSKGLEYKIVILPFLESDLNKSPTESAIKKNKDFGLGLMFFDEVERIKKPSVYYDAICIKNRNSDIAERIRLLYVAMTRAKNRLIMFGTAKKMDFEKHQNSFDVIKAKSYLHYIVGSLPADEIESLCVVDNFNMFKKDKFVLNVIDEDSVEITFEEKGGFDKNIKITDEYVEYIKKQYFNSYAQNVAKKNSVTQILQAQEFVSYNVAPKNLTINEHSENLNVAKDLGILYHKIIESVDFSKQYIEDVKQIIMQIKKSGEFEGSLFSLLDLNLIENNIKLLNSICLNKKLYKEKSFVMQIPYNEIKKQSSVVEKVLIQGVCDLIAEGEDEIVLIDYKYSSKDSEKLKNDYATQIQLYKMAIEKSFKKRISKCFILSIKKAQLIEIN